MELLLDLGPPGAGDLLVAESRLERGRPLVLGRIRRFRPRARLEFAICACKADVQQYVVLSP